MSILQAAERGNGLSPLYPHGNEPRAPYSIPAEQAVLGALLYNNKASEYISDLLPEHFYDPFHASIFEAISEALLSSRPFSASTLAERFRHINITGTDEDGAMYLARLVQYMVPIAHVRENARIVMDCAQRRLLMLIAEDIYSKASDLKSSSEASGIVEEAEKELYKVASRATNTKEMAYSEAIKLALDAAHKAYQSDGNIDGVTTGFADLDAKLGALGNGNLIILAGRPSMGKTALVLNIANNVAQQGDHVHFFSQEMTAVELGLRQLSEYSGIASDKLRFGQFEEHEFRNIFDAAKRLSGLSMTIDETGANTIGALSTKARRIKRQKRTKLIIIDYLQIMGTAGKGGNRVNDITEITVGLKALAKELDVPIIALSQLNRDLEKRTDRRPQLSDLRESGSIEQDADVVMSVYREEYYWTRENPKPDPSDELAFGIWQDDFYKHGGGLAEIIIGKQRHGSIGTVTLQFDGSRTSFANVAKGAPKP